MDGTPAIQASSPSKWPDCRVSPPCRLGEPPQAEPELSAVGRRDVSRAAIRRFIRQRALTGRDARRSPGNRSAAPLTRHLPPLRRLPLERRLTKSAANGPPTRGNYFLGVGALGAQSGILNQVVVARKGLLARSIRDATRPSNGAPRLSPMRQSNPLSRRPASMDPGLEIRNSWAPTRH